MEMGGEGRTVEASLEHYGRLGEGLGDLVAVLAELFLVGLSPTHSPDAKSDAEEEREAEVVHCEGSLRCTCTCTS